MSLGFIFTMPMVSFGHGMDETILSLFRKLTYPNTKIQMMKIRMMAINR
jgi:hypothetical protein